MAKTEFQQELSSASANAVYLLKTEDDIITGIVSLQNGANANKHLDNLQEHIYTVGDIIGIVGENDPNALIYTSTNYISNGDNRKVAIEKLDTQTKLNADNIASNLILIGDNAAQIALNIQGIGDNAAQIALNIQGIIDARSIWEQEVPTGLIDAVNDEFVLSGTPQSDKAVMLYLNGLIQFQTVHYTILASTITMITPPAIGQDLYAVYDRGL